MVKNILSILENNRITSFIVNTPEAGHTADQAGPTSTTYIDKAQGFDRTIYINSAYETDDVVDVESIADYVVFVDDVKFSIKYDGLDYEILRDGFVVETILQTELADPPVIDVLGKEYEFIVNANGSITLNEKLPTQFVEPLNANSGNFVKLDNNDIYSITWDADNSQYIVSNGKDRYLSHRGKTLTTGETIFALGISVHNYVNINGKNL